MDSDTVRSKAEEYLTLLNDIRVKTQDERTALAILQEVNKDIRMAQIRAEREHGNGPDQPATVRQKNYLKKLGVDIPANLTKREASRLIDQEVGQESD